MSEKIRVAFIGCGKRARAHARGVSDDQRSKVVGLADVNESAATAMAHETGLGEAKVFANYRVMLDELKPDVSIISLWTPLHLPVFRDCAEAGVKAVVCEKPIAATWGDCVEMAALAERSGCRLSFCHQRRFASGNQLVRRLIAAGVFGKIERMDLYSPRDLLDCGTHTIDQAISFNDNTPGRWVLGSVDVSELTRVFDMRVELMATAEIVFANGVRANLQAGGPDMDLWGGVRVMGSEGFITVTWDGEVKRAVRYADPAWIVPNEAEEACNEQAMMAALYRHTFDCLLEGRESDISCRNAMMAMEIIYGIYESVRRRARVEIPLALFSDHPLASMVDVAAHSPEPAV